MATLAVEVRARLEQLEAEDARMRIGLERPI
jgi:hypothetical protein